MQLVPLHRGDTPTVASVQLGDVAKQFTTVTLFWEEYLAAVDQHMCAGGAVSLSRGGSSPSAWCSDDRLPDHRSTACHQQP
jgi:hypothetical protein